MSSIVDTIKAKLQQLTALLSALTPQLASVATAVTTVGVLAGGVLAATGSPQAGLVVSAASAVGLVLARATAVVKALQDDIALILQLLSQTLANQRALLEQSKAKEDKE